MNINLAFIIIGVLGLMEVFVRTVFLSTESKSKLITIYLPIVNAIGYVCIIIVGFLMPPIVISTLNKSVESVQTSSPIVDLPEEYVEISKDSSHPTFLLGYFRRDTLVITFDPQMDDD